MGTSGCLVQLTKSSTSLVIVCGRENLMRYIGRYCGFCVFQYFPQIIFLLQQVISDHPKVAECSCIGVDDILTGQAIAAFAVLNNGVPNTPEVKQDIINLIRNRIGVCQGISCSLQRQFQILYSFSFSSGAIATPKILQIVNALPKTRSGPH